MASSESAGEGIQVIDLVGRLDMLTADSVRQKLLAAVAASGARLVLDLSGLVYVSSAGLRVLLEVARRVTAGQGKLAMCALGRTVLQVFELAGFAALIPTFGTRAEALAALA
jgi:anti-anti-sigma factor